LWVRSRRPSQIRAQCQILRWVPNGLVKLNNSNKNRVHSASARLRHECHYMIYRRGNSVGFAFGVGGQVECRRDCRAEGWESIRNLEYDVWFLGAIWTKFCYRLCCKLIKLKSLILLYQDILYIFEPGHCAGPSHRMHEPMDAPGPPGPLSHRSGMQVPPFSGQWVDPKFDKTRWIPRALLRDDLCYL